jgi:NAD(P)-dependent dehydrogenase (short-subunit alcohol dehydrogenase family)
VTIDIFHGAAAIVTGGASGLGAATARKLAKQGLKICLFDINTEAGTTLAKEIGASFYDVDIADASSVATGIEQAEKQHGIAKLLVNCAGIGGASRTVSPGQAHDPALFLKIINVNLIGCFSMVSQIAAKMMTAASLDADGSRGVIINTSSIAAFEGQR